MSPIAFCTLQMFTLVTYVFQSCSGLNSHRDTYSNMPVYQNLSRNSFAGTTLRSLPKKLRVGIVTPQQHEKIINVLWRKYHIFSDEEGTSDSYTRLPTFLTPALRAEDSLDIFTDVSRRPAKESLFTRFPAVQAENSNIFRGDFATPSVPLRQLLKYSFTESLVPKTKHTTSGNVIVTTPYIHRLCICDPYTLQRSPRTIYHINKPIYRHKLPFSFYDKLIEKVKRYSHETTSAILTENSNLKDSIISKTSNKSMQKVWPTLKRHNRENYDNYIKTTPMLSVQNDKVKFFEIYDSDTDAPVKYAHGTTYNNNYNINNTETQFHDKPEFTKAEPEYITTLQLPEKEISKIKLRITFNKDIGLGSWKKRWKEMDGLEKRKEINVGKEITEKALSGIRTQANIININPIVREMKLINKEEVTIRSLGYPEKIQSTIQESLWSKYPFVAVYVDDRLNVHCDAAAISSFWLLAAASCLSRHQDHPLNANRPAYVAYCGDRWWNPERISYVKSIKIHPKFNVNDAVRRHLYNVGVIRVLTSMKTSCPNWSPVNIMSYHYEVGPNLTFGTAIGWGLDRYDSSYASKNLPKQVLSKYEGRLYTSSCPGNIGYRITKQLSNEAAENVYCLSLPPYSGESTDPVHGALLLVEGNLIALYLQEERRKWGNQCAQYTAVWKLLPWVLETTNKLKESQFF